MSDKIHRFEEAGLGKAPFRLVGIWTMPSKALLEANPEAWNNAMREAPRTNGGGVGCCHFCGTPIIDHFIIKSSDKRTFMVGSDCVLKTGDAGLISIANREANRLKREAKRVRDEARIANARKLLAVPSVRNALKLIPHPFKDRADKGETRLGWADWMMGHAGISGMIEASKVIERIAKDGDAIDPAVVEAAVAKRDREREEALGAELAAAVEREIRIRERNARLIDALAPFASNGNFFGSIAFDLAHGVEASGLPAKAKRIIADKLRRAGHDEDDVWEWMS